MGEHTIALPAQIRTGEHRILPSQRARSPTLQRPRPRIHACPARHTPNTPAAGDTAGSWRRVETARVACVQVRAVCEEEREGGACCAWRAARSRASRPRRWRPWRPRLRGSGRLRCLTARIRGVRPRKALRDWAGSGMVRVWFEGRGTVGCCGEVESVDDGLCRPFYVRLNPNPPNRITNLYNVRNTTSLSFASRPIPPSPIAQNPRAEHSHQSIHTSMPSRWVSPVPDITVHQARHK